MLTHVDYGCGRMHDMHCVTRWVHAAGAELMDLGQTAPKFAVGCGYKQRAKVA